MISSESRCIHTIVLTLPLLVPNFWAFLLSRLALSYRDEIGVLQFRFLLDKHSVTTTVFSGFPGVNSIVKLYGSMHIQIYSAKNYQPPKSQEELNITRLESS